MRYTSASSKHFDVICERMVQIDQLSDEMRKLTCEPDVASEMQTVPRKQPKWARLSRSTINKVGTRTCQGSSLVRAGPYLAREDGVFWGEMAWSKSPSLCFGRESRPSAIGFLGEKDPPK